jgi:formate hydrogenlyase subunit 3/multisubunit Na+/H+ antiporter MnhD subunit
VSILLLVAACIGIGLAIRLLRRLPRLVFAASLIGAVLLAAILSTAPSGSVYFVGRALTLDAGARAFLWLVIGIAATLAFFGPLSFEPAVDSPTAIIANSQGAFFFWSLAPLIVAIVLDSFPLAVFFWAIGLIVLMMMATPRREGRVGGAAQFLLLTVVAVACLFLFNRLIELYPLTPENLDLIRSAVIFLSLGLGLLLAVVPLHIWLGPLADEMPPLGVAFLVGVAQPVGLWLLFQQMSAAQWLTERTVLLTILLFGGGLTAAVGALLALTERRDGRFIAYLSLVSLAQALVGLSLGTRAGLASALLAILNRAVGIALVAGGLALVRNHPERRWQIIGGMTILAGGLTLAGIPPLLGFAAQWSIYRDLAVANLFLVIVLLASNAVVLLATLRVVQPLFVERSEAGETGETKIVPYLSAAVAFVLFVIVILAGIFPHAIAEPLMAALGNASYLK